MSAGPDSPAAYLADRPVLSRRQGWLLCLVAALAAGLFGHWLAGETALQRFEDASIDQRFRIRGPRTPPDNILIVELDDDSRVGLRDAGRFDLRHHLATAIDNLAEAGALVVGIDIWLDGLTSPETDARLAEVIAASDVVLAVAYTGGRSKRAPALFLASEPLEGLIVVNPDAGVLRRFADPLFLDILGPSGSIDDLQVVPHFTLALALYAAWANDENAQIEPGDGNAEIGGHSIRAGELIDFASTSTVPAGNDTNTSFSASANTDTDTNTTAGADTLVAGWQTLRFHDVVQGRFDAAAVRDRIVLIGQTGKLMDSFVMPLSDELVPGVFYHANAVAHILEDRSYDAQWSDGSRRSWLSAILAAVAGIAAWRRRRAPRHGRGTLLLLLSFVFSAMLLIGGWLLLSVAVFERNVLLPVVAPSIAMAAALAAGRRGQWHIATESARRMDLRARRIETLFGQSVSTEVLAALKQRPESIAATETREVSVLFCDIRGFTAVSESMAPAEVAAMLNEYFNYVTAPIFENDGFLDKFVGDEVMAVFNVPFEQPDHVERAVRTAVAVKQRLAELNSVRLKRGQPPLNCGLGIHCGPAATGHIGSQRRSNYTVVGATVNLAARIEGFTTGGEILISEAVRASLPTDITAKPWKTVEIKGLGDKHALFEVVLN